MDEAEPRFVLGRPPPLHGYRLLVRGTDCWRSQILCGGILPVGMEAP